MTSPRIHRVGCANLTLCVRPIAPRRNGSFSSDTLDRTVGVRSIAAQRCARMLKLHSALRSRKHGTKPMSRRELRHAGDARCFNFLGKNGDSCRRQSRSCRRRVGVLQRTYGGRGPNFSGTTPLRAACVSKYRDMGKNFCARVTALDVDLATQPETKPAMVPQGSRLWRILRSTSPPT